MSQRRRRWEDLESIRYNAKTGDFAFDRVAVIAFSSCFASFNIALLALLIFYPIPGRLIAGSIAGLIIAAAAAVVRKIRRGRANAGEYEAKCGASATPLKAGAVKPRTRKPSPHARQGESECGSGNVQNGMSDVQSGRRPAA